jgi:hypothetical protein
MGSFTSLLALDMEQASARKGAVGLLAVVLALVFIALFGTVGMTAGVAALFVFAADSPGAPADRIRGVLVMTVGGALIASVAVWAGTGTVWAATLLTFVIAGLGTIAAGFGAGAATRGLLLTLWAVVALSFAGDADSGLEVAGAYLVGGLIAAAILWVQARTPLAESAVGARDSTPALAEIVASPLGLFALVRAAAVGLATFLGIELFPEHAIWPALTVVLVLRPKLGDTLEKGVLRTIGTLVGVAAAGAVVALADGSDAVVIAAFLVAAFAMVALKDVNYWVFVLFLTAVLVLMQELLGADADAAGADRLLATLLGSGIAFAGIGVGLLIVRGPASGQRVEGDEDT